MKLTQKVAISLAVVVAVALATTPHLPSVGGDGIALASSACYGKCNNSPPRSIGIRSTRVLGRMCTGSSITPDRRRAAIRRRGAVACTAAAEPAPGVMPPTYWSILLTAHLPAMHLMRQCAGYCVPVMLDGAEVARLVLVGDTNGLGPNEQALLSQACRSIALSAIVSALFALALGAVLMTNILQPLKKIEAGVAAVARGDLSARVVDDSRRDELGRLAANFNSMASSLQEQEQLRRRLVSDLAHELRTPLSVIQGNLQALLDGVYPLSMDELQTVYDETDLLVRLVHDLHELAQAEAGRLPLSLQHIQAHSALQHMANPSAPSPDSVWPPRRTSRSGGLDDAG